MIWEADPAIKCQFIGWVREYNGSRSVNLCRVFGLAQVNRHKASMYTYLQLFFYDVSDRGLNFL